MNKTNILAIVLAVLVVISVVQAFQLTGLKTKLDSGQVSTKSVKPAVKSSPGSGDSANLPKSLDNLPQMVGGC